MSKKQMLQPTFHASLAAGQGHPHPCQIHLSGIWWTVQRGPPPWLSPWSLEPQSLNSPLQELCSQPICEPTLGPPLALRPGASCLEPQGPSPGVSRTRPPVPASVTRPPL